MPQSRRRFLFDRLRISRDTPTEDAGFTQDVRAEQAPPLSPASSLTTISRKAMAGEFEIDLNTGQYDSGSGAALDALDVVTRLEEKLSFFRPKSRISYINAVAAYEPVAVDEELYGLLVLCRDLYSATDGCVDITSTPLWQVWGFARREGRIPTDEEIETARENVGGHLVELDDAARTVRFLKPGVAVNLGCVGKGFALDLAAQTLLDAGIGDFLMHGGLSSVLARGEQWSKGPKGEEGEKNLVENRTENRPLKICNENPGWKVGITDPMRPGRRLKELRLHDQALGTSGTRHQFFRHRGRRYGHILDPRSGFPVEGIVSVTVIAPTAAEADLLSTAFFVMGPEKTAVFCRSRPELAVTMVLETDKGAGYETLHFP